jgi:hypothetical protein
MDNQIILLVLQEWDRVLNHSRLTISKSSFELKWRWRAEVSGTLKDIVEANDSFRTLRDCLTNVVVTTSYYQVLMQHVRDDQGTPLSSIFHPKISWRLSEHILEIARKDKELRRLVVAHNENLQELLDYVRYNFERHYVNLAAINAMRTTMEDVGDDQDWFPQFYISMCIWQEDMVRKQIGLPGLFNTKEQSNNLDSTKYRAFKTFVQSGNKFPHRDWQQLYGTDLVEASFLVPKKP